MNIRKIIGKNYVSIRYQLFKLLSPKMYPALIKMCALIEMGEKMDLKNPQTINEKIQWLKIYDTNPIKTRLADKYEVRQWVADKIGEDKLIPLLGIWNKFEDIDFDSLPKKFVLKATHGCGCNLIVLDKEKFDYQNAKRKFKKWMKTNYSYFTGEKQYKNIVPRIIAEEYVENCSRELYDYKVFCFNGKAKYIMFLSDRHTSLKMAFYDTAWNRQPFTYSYPQIEGEVPKPLRLTEMIEKAEIMSKDFEVVRVDFYILNDGSIKFGEMTFASAGGFCKWLPEEYNHILGNEIILHELTKTQQDGLQMFY